MSARQRVVLSVAGMVPGKRMFDCHLLPHEDAGMMAVLDVQPA